jgi:hypothetical protein
MKALHYDLLSGVLIFGILGTNFSWLQGNDFLHHCPLIIWTNEAMITLYKTFEGEVRVIG